MTVDDSSLHTKQLSSMSTPTDTPQWKNCNPVSAFEAPHTTYWSVSFHTEPQKHGAIVKEWAYGHKKKKKAIH